MSENDGRRTEGAPPNHIHIEKKATNWLAWLALGLGVLALLFALSRCHRDGSSGTTTTTTNTVVAETPNAPQVDALTGTSALGGYLAGTDPAPRTFTFDKLNFDTAKSDVRAADEADIEAVAAVLKRYPATRIRIAGYADARGTDAANMALGKARADSVKSALVAQGINAGRIETVSGGETDPVDTNATAGGRFENRRTELVVTAR